ncbi:MAG: sulfotransferase [Bacteriovoracaceae bacterium]|jgi:sulfotransferase|nr:sulfotransferase [Bacteriovoracaceae bacterium]
MTDKNYIFISGLPRSGSTLLANILDQNPNFRSDAITSGLSSLLGVVKENWEKIESFRSWKDISVRKNVLSGIFHSYYNGTQENNIVDKSRMWPSHIETLEMVLGKKPKIIMCVRDMRAIMASWEKMWRANKDLFSLNIPIEARHTIESRVAYWGSSKDHTGKAYLIMQDAISRGHSDCMLFVDFEKLTSEPVKQLERIYRFLEIDSFSHDFNNIKQVNIEDDPVSWMKDLHTIRSKVEPFNSNWEQILGPQARGLADSNTLWVDRV